MLTNKSNPAQDFASHADAVKEAEKISAKKEKDGYRAPAAASKAAAVLPAAVPWFWAGDSKSGSQDIWIPYAPAVAAALEAGLAASQPQESTDTQRYVQFSDMTQRRFDNPHLNRRVRRGAGSDSEDEDDDDDEDDEDSAAVSSADDKDDEDDDDEDEDDDDDDDAGAAAGPPRKRLKSSGPAANAVAAPAPPPAYPPATGLAAQFGCPPNWTSFDSMALKEVDVPLASSEAQWVQHLFTQTTSPNHVVTGSMNHIHHVKFASLRVSRVVRVQNPACWMRYKQRRDSLLQQHAAQPFPRCAKIKTEGVGGGAGKGKARAKAGGQSVAPPSALQADVNEAWLFHGLNPAHMDAVCKFGFDPRHCNLEGMFGAALYFAEDSSKSNQYTHAVSCSKSGFQGTAQCTCKQSDEVCMLLARVLLGDALVEKKHRGNRPGEFWHKRRSEPEKPGGGGGGGGGGGAAAVYNSVVGESIPNFSGATLQLREYIVYEASQIYPEYKVYYKRAL